MLPSNILKTKNLILELSLVLFFTFFINNNAFALSINIESLDKNKVVVYTATYNNQELLPEDEWVAVKQLEALGFKTENIINNKNFNDKNYPDYFHALKMIDEYQNFRKNILMDSYDPSIEDAFGLIWIFNKYYPSDEFSKALSQIPINYNNNEKLSRNAINLIKKNGQTFVNLAYSISNKVQLLNQQFKHIDDRYTVNIRLNQEYYSNYKSAHENYQDILDMAEQGYATESQLSLKNKGTYFSIRINFTPTVFYFNVIDDNSLWMGICKKYKEEESKALNKRLEERNNREKQYEI